MTVSPPGHEHYFEELVKLVAREQSPGSKCHRGFETPLRHRTAIGIEKIACVAPDFRAILSLWKPGHGWTLDQGATANSARSLSPWGEGWGQGTTNSR